MWEPHWQCASVINNGICHRCSLLDLGFYQPHSREIIRLVAPICSRSLFWPRLCILDYLSCGVVDIRARLAECSKNTMTHGIQSNICVCVCQQSGGCLQSASCSGRSAFKTGLLHYTCKHGKTSWLFTA